MTIPGRREAARLLTSLEPPGVVRAARVRGRGRRGLAGGQDEGAGAAVDVGLVEAAALLHDVDKLPWRRPRPTCGTATARRPGWRRTGWWSSGRGP